MATKKNLPKHQAQNKVVEKVFEGAKGVTKEKPWQIYDVYFEGSEHKFTYFHRGSKLIPTVGMKCIVVEFEIEVKKKGDKEYENRTITNLILEEGQKIPESQPESQQESKQESSGSGPTGQPSSIAITPYLKNDPWWFIMAYLKDLQIARIQKIENPAEYGSLEVLATEWVETSFKVRDMIKEKLK